MNVLMLLEGVLRRDNGQLIPAGLMLYNALLPQRVVLATELAPELVDHFLKINKLTQHVKVIYEVPFTVTAESMGYRPELYVDPSPERCAAAMAKGITTLLFAAPKYQRPEWRPDRDRSQRPWHEIVAELDKQADAAAGDSRLVLDGA